MRPKGYSGPYLKNDITHPVTLISFFIVLLVGGWIFFCQLSNANR